MVVGNGLIASQFYDYKRNDLVVIFASGVSNSSNIAAEPFERELQLLKSVYEKNSDKKLVYFSTSSISDRESKNNKYVKHKLEMENWIKQSVTLFTIFRLTNPIGKNNNPNTVFNFFVNHILSKTPFVVWQNAFRNIMDIDDMYRICHYILNKDLFLNEVVVVANPKSYPVINIVHEIENYFETKGNFTLLDKGNDLHIDTAPIAPIIEKLSIQFDKDYLQKILNKYFPKQ